MHWLIAGYNTLPADEKAKYDIEAIATLFRNVFLSMAALIILGYFAAQWLEKPMIEGFAFWAAIIIGIPFLLIKANSKRYKINS